MAMSDHQPWSRIVVGVDDADSSQAALRWGIEEASCRGALVEAVHAWRARASTPQPGTFTDCKLEAQETVDRCLERLPEHPGIIVQGRIVEGRPGDVLVAEAGDPDTVLLVVGSGHRGNVARLLLGSTTEACVHHSACPVVVVPATDGVEHAWTVPTTPERQPA
jgi:nucleotide-binding universal stress UspA family protein